MKTDGKVISIEEAANKTANPEAAYEALEFFSPLAPDVMEEALLIPLAHLGAGSKLLVRWLTRRPQDLKWLTADNLVLQPRSPRDMIDALKNLLIEFPDDPAKALRVFKHRELARICARELSGMADVTETLREWSAVADAAIDFAIEVAAYHAKEKNGEAFFEPQEGGDEQKAGFAAIAMGKLGGDELNISSDIDLIFVHSSDNGRTANGKASLHEHFVAIARETAKLLNDLTEDGFVFRVDLDLRPEGRSGELTNSIGAMEIYYESWGHAWERQALIKARHCGGDKKVTTEVLDRLRPFVYRKYLDEKAIGEIAAMKDKIDASLRSKKGAIKAMKNLKLGKGGIREIEFVAQSFQLLYGARYLELKTRSTLTALTAATSLGLLSEPHHRDLTDIYLFYRQLENRVQYQEGLQTHDIPQEGKSLEILARQVGISGKNCGEKLLLSLAAKRERVRSIFDLFFTKEKEEQILFPAPLEEEDTITEWLDSLCFDRPAESAKLLNILGNGKAFAHVTEKSSLMFDDFGPELIAEAAKTSWPDNVLIGFEKLVEARGDRDMLYDMLNRHRPLLTLLAALFSSSESLTQILIRQPDLFDRVVGAYPIGKPPDRAEYKSEFNEAVSGDRNIEDKISILNMIRAAKLLRIGLRRILDFSDRFETMESLTLLAEEYIKALAKLASADGGPGDDNMNEDAGWIILVGGKLGRREMNFGSDIDMIVFHDGSDAENIIRLTQTMAKLSKMITPYGAGYEIDLRLRPDGEKGPLAPSFESMRDYYKTRAEAWERLALVGVRPIAGDKVFGDKVMETVEKFIYDSPLSPSATKKIAAIREKIVEEKVKPGVIDIKFGRGGLIEIEFICQILHMTHHKIDSGRRIADPFTITIISRAKKDGWLGGKECATLEKAYIIYRSIEDALRMDKAQSVNVAPQEGHKLVRIARRAAIAGVGPERFVETIKETMPKVRAIYEIFMSQRSAA